MPTLTIPASEFADPTDQTGQLGLLFRDKVKDGDTLIFAERPTPIQLDGTLRLVGRKDLTIQQEGVAFKTVVQGDRNRAHVSVENCDNIAWDAYSVVGPHAAGGNTKEAWVPELEAQAGFQVLGSRGVTLTDAKIRNVYGDFVYVGEYVQKTVTKSGSVFTRINPSDVTIDGLDGQYNGRQGVAFTIGENYVLTNSKLSDVRRAMVDIEPNTTSQTVNNVTVSGNTLINGGLMFVAAGGPGHVNNVGIVGNTLRGMVMGISCHWADANDRRRRSNWVVVGNRTNTKTNGYALRFHDVDGVTAAWNVQPAGRPAATPLELVRVTGDQVDFNSFVGAANPIVRA